MANIHIMIGIPGSGKTTFVENFKKVNDYLVVSTDLVRKNNPGIVEDDVWPEVYKQIGLSLQNNKDVIFDATSISPKVRKRLKDNVDKYCNSYDIIGYYFPLHSDYCVKRVEKRNKLLNELFIPTDVIASYGEKIIPPTYEESFKESKVVFNEPLLLSNLVSDSYQGYAFYFKNEKSIEIEEYSGFADIDTYEPVRQKTNFRLASVSKQFIAYGILDLYSKGLLDLDDDLYSLFDNMPDYTKDIKIRNLLNHTSGINDYESMEHTEEQVQDKDVLDFVRKTNTTYFPINSKYQYSNTAYVLLGLIIEKVSNRLLGDYLQDEVFKKAGMENTCANYEKITVIEPRAYGNITKKDSNHLFKKDQYWCSATIGDGGIYSNIPDLKKWIKYISTITKYPYNLMKETNIINGKDIEYGFGLRVKKINNKYQVIYHCGDTIGTNTIIGYVPDLGIEFAFLTNKNGIDTAKFVTNLTEYLNKKEYK